MAKNKGQFDSMRTDTDGYWGVLESIFKQAIIDYRFLKKERVAIRAWVDSKDFAFWCNLIPSVDMMS